MKLIIDISEDDLDAIKFLKVKGWASRHELLILDGTPIPDNATVGEVFCMLRDAECFRAGINTTLNIIDKYKGDKG